MLAPGGLHRERQPPRSFSPASRITGAKRATPEAAGCVQRPRRRQAPLMLAPSSRSSTLAGAMSFYPALLFLRPRPLLASDVAFGVLFGVFVVALLALIVIVVVWAVRRDRQGRAAWRQRQLDRSSAAEGDVPPTPPMTPRP